MGGRNGAQAPDGHTIHGKRRRIGASPEHRRGTGVALAGDRTVATRREHVVSDSAPDNDEPRDPQAAFEEFTAGSAWRELPLKIKLLVFRLWRAEHDTRGEPEGE